MVRYPPKPNIIDLEVKDPTYFQIYNYIIILT